MPRPLRAQRGAPGSRGEGSQGGAPRRACEEQPIVTCRAWSSAAWEGGRRFGKVRPGSGHLEATIWCPLTIGRVRRLGRSASAGGAFDSRASNARARRCNQTCRAADDPMAPDLAARRGQLRPQSPRLPQGKSPASRELRGYRPFSLAHGGDQRTLLERSTARDPTTAAAATATAAGSVSAECACTGCHYLGRDT